MNKKKIIIIILSIMLAIAVGVLLVTKVFNKKEDNSKEKEENSTENINFIEDPNDGMPGEDEGPGEEE